MLPSDGPPSGTDRQGSERTPSRSSIRAGFRRVAHTATFTIGWWSESFRGGRADALQA